VFAFSVVLHPDLSHPYLLHDVCPAYCRVAKENYDYPSSSSEEDVHHDAWAERGKRIFNHNLKSGR
jgi:hypothetical protein